MAKTEIDVYFRLPFWWREAISLAMIVESLGGEIDVDALAEFIVKHGRVTFK